MTIYDVLTASEKDLFDYAILSCPAKTITGDGENYLYLDNGFPICFVAHVDTCQRKAIELITKNNIVGNKHGILGADDRAGVYAILELARKYRINILFTNYEETGGKGARLAAKELSFPGVNLFIELDRKGANEFVFYSYDLPKQVKSYMQSFGFHEDWGSYSDIAEFDCAPAVNCSIGYYNQHTSHEYLDLDVMNMSIDKMKRIIANPISKLHQMKYTRYTKDYSWDIKAQKHFNFRDKTKKLEYPCDFCRGYFDMKDIVFMNDFNLCRDCWIQHHT